MSRRTASATFAVTLVAGATVLSEYARVDIRNVPVARLTENFERQLADNPNDVRTLINLARLHGMAYALKTEQAEAVQSRSGTVEPWYGYPLERKHIPYGVKKTTSPDVQRRAEAHLSTAIGHYRRATELDPKNLLARLGYAWTLDQSGKKSEAIEEYRRVIREAWPTEQSGKSVSVAVPFFTQEAADYLIPLLDLPADAKEIEDLRQKRNKLGGFPRAITPIAVPLADGLPPERVVDATARVLFDADGSGLKRRWTWISHEAGWLVYDAGGTGEITSALQWFGNVTFWLFWNNGYEALASLDDDANGELTGAELRRLAIWDDANANGRSERGEVKPLSGYGIAALSCLSIDGDGTRFAAVSRRGVRFADGRTRPTYDVILRRAPETTF
jgi:hypothetical protein